VTPLAQVVCHLLRPLFLGFVVVDVCAVYAPPYKRLDMSDAKADDEHGEGVDGDMEMDEDYNVEQKGVDAFQVAQVKVSWTAFWDIPLVRFVTHAAVNLANIALLVYVLWSPRYYHANRETWDILLPIDFDAMAVEQIVLEVIFWTSYFGRLVEEVKQMAKEPLEYFNT
jgi:hypothetical protein